MNKQRISKKRFAVCITASEADLELRKVYQILPDELAAKDDYVRGIDESSDDYLYPSSYFVFAEMPKPVECALNAALKMVNMSKQTISVAAQ